MGECIFFYLNFVTSPKTFLNLLFFSRDCGTLRWQHNKVITRNYGNSSREFIKSQDKKKCIHPWAMVSTTTFTEPIVSLALAARGMLQLLVRPQSTPLTIGFSVVIDCCYFVIIGKSVTEQTSSAESSRDNQFV